MKETLGYVRGLRAQAEKAKPSSYKLGFLAACDDLIEFLEERIELEEA